MLRVEKRRWLLLSLVNERRCWLDALKPAEFRNPVKIPKSLIATHFKTDLDLVSSGADYVSRSQAAESGRAIFILM